MLGANLDDYLFPPTNFEKILIVGNGFVIVILLDLIVNFIGAFVFSIFGYLYILNEKKYKVAGKFLTKKRNE